MFSSAAGVLPGASNARFSWPKSSLVWIYAYLCLGGTEIISLSLSTKSPRLELRTEGTFQLSEGVLNHIFFPRYVYNLYFINYSWHCRFPASLARINPVSIISHQVYMACGCHQSFHSCGISQLLHTSVCDVVHVFSYLLL